MPKPAWRAPGPATRPSRTAKRAWTISRIEFHRKVYQAYHALAAAEPERVKDGRTAAPDIDEIEREVWSIVSALCLRISGATGTSPKRWSRCSRRTGSRRRCCFPGREGVGKATLARRLGGAPAGAPGTDRAGRPGLPENLDTIAAREKWTAEKRNEDPLLFATHPDFVTFAARRAAAPDLHSADAPAEGSARNICRTRAPGASS